MNSHATAAILQHKGLETFRPTEANKLGFTQESSATLAAALL
jgi:hypothetical protein